MYNWESWETLAYSKEREKKSKQILLKYLQHIYKLIGSTQSTAYVQEKKTKTKKFENIISLYLR